MVFQGFNIFRLPPAHPKASYFSTSGTSMTDKMSCPWVCHLTLFQSVQWSIYYIWTLQAWIPLQPLRSGQMKWTFCCNSGFCLSVQAKNMYKSDQKKCCISIHALNPQAVPHKIPYLFRVPNLFPLLSWRYRYWSCAARKPNPLLSSSLHCWIIDPISKQLIRAFHPLLILWSNSFSSMPR